MPANHTATSTDEPILVCDRCGKVPAQRIAHRVLCDDCYQALGACCHESEELEEPDPPSDSSSSKSAK